MNENISGILVILFIFLFGFGTGYVYHPEPREPCWDTTSDAVFEGWYQEIKSELEWKIERGTATDEDVERYETQYSYPVSMRYCIGEKVFDGSDILYYRKMTRKEMYRDRKENE